jgi:hypothetical protein
MADLNIVNVSTINGRTAGANLTSTSTVSVVTNTFGNSKTFKINTILLANKGANTVSSNVSFRSYSGSNTSYPVVFNIDVPPKASIDVLSKSFYLQEGDVITANSSSGSDVSIIVSYEEMA